MHIKEHCRLLKKSTLLPPLPSFVRKTSPLHFFLFLCDLFVASPLTRMYRQESILFFLSSRIKKKIQYQVYPRVCCSAPPICNGSSRTRKKKETIGRFFYISCLIASILRKEVEKKVLFLFFFSFT